MADYATVEDVIELYRPLTEEEAARTASILPVISARLREEARKRGHDLDQMIAADDSGDLAVVAKSVTVDITARYLMTPTSGPSYGPVTQFTESAGGYSATGTFLNPGGGLFIKKSELAALGLRRQKYGVVDIYADPWNTDNPL